MIQGTGTDIIEIERIRKAMVKPAFLARCFTSREIEAFTQRGLKAETVAGCFAAKEAVSKAIGTGFGRLNWTDVEIIKEAGGKPLVELNANGWAIAAEKGITGLQVSISHCKAYAVAFSIAEQL